MLMTTTAMNSPIILSDEQLAIARHVDGGRGNILVRARAGTGKTFLLRQCVPLMRGRVAYVVFGKKNADEAVQKFGADGSNADIATFDSFGFRACRRAYPGVKVEGMKAGNAGFMKFEKIAEDLEIPNHITGFVQKAMRLAMKRGFGVAGVCALNDRQAWMDLVAHYNLDDEIAEDNIALKLHGREKLIQMGCQFAAKAVKASIQMAHEVISFADMLYIPLVMNLPIDRYQWVLGDEFQDSNPVRRIFARRMMAPGGRAMFVGDDRQAIMGFTGADNDALDLTAREFNCAIFPMTETRRCSQAVVELAQALVPDYRAHPSNAAGSVTYCKAAEFAAFKMVPGEDAVICRNTAPLVRAAYSLIARGVPAHVEGKEIGTGLINLINRWPSITTIPALTERLEKHREKEVAKLTAEKKDAAAEAVNDKVDTIISIMQTLPHGATVQTLRADISALFADNADGKKAPTVALMTAHKSKGLEFRRVFGWGVERFFPSPFAKQEWQMQQETNLEYVLYTRAMVDYIGVEVE